jgi:dimethylamine/trimethylamine dehydrogenase
VTLARRGYEVTLADREAELGGRLRYETRLPGLATWGRVVQWRLGQLRERPNVQLYPGSELGVEDVLGLEHRHVVIATGARWSRMLYGTIEFPVGLLESPRVYTPDDLAAGVLPEPPITVFDFDNYYLGSAIAEDLARRVSPVTYLTTAGHASEWTIMTNELPLVHRALVRAGVAIRTLERVIGFDGERLSVGSVFGGAGEPVVLECRSLVIVGVRQPDDALAQALRARPQELERAGIESVRVIGDALAPGAIVHAVHSGHRYARELGEAQSDSPYVRDFQLGVFMPQAGA